MLKYHLFSTSERSQISWLYFCIVKLFVHAHVLFGDLGCLRKITKIFDEFSRRFCVHGWSLYVGSFSAVLKRCKLLYLHLLSTAIFSVTSHVLLSRVKGL